VASAEGLDGADLQITGHGRRGGERSGCARPRPGQGEWAYTHLL